MASAGQEAYVCEPGPAMTYLTGVTWGRSERPFLLVLPAGGPPAWIVPAFEASRASERVGASARVLTWDEHSSPFARLTEVIPAGRGVALDPDLRLFVARGIQAAWNLSARPGPDPVAAAR
ncbi:MAG TPA: hypothetical protein ENJ15_01275, partial [Caldithrix abyssi]|nr:hypothetical protein [Caldithrix abyssi]